MSLMRRFYQQFNCASQTMCCR
ncbi:hypothetical protein Golax_023183, partial [Gossypium laxum]|nr:hypothetical protein [Gossypium laxum]